jgi:hypothetical protein
LDEDEQAAEDEELKEADEENTDVGKLLTKAIIAQWAVQLKKFSLSALKKVVRALYETTVAAEKDAELHGVKRYVMDRSCMLTELNLFLPFWILHCSA